MSRPSCTTVAPLLAIVALVPAWYAHPEGAVVLGLLAVLLVSAVLAAVHHAEVVAHRVGEPFGSLVLAVAVTVIEVALIVTLMVSGGDRNVAFVFVGEDRGQARYRHALMERATHLGVETLMRIVGHYPDMPTALAAADVVVIPSIEAPLTGRAAAEAQALGRPVVSG